MTTKRKSRMADWIQLAYKYSSPSFNYNLITVKQKNIQKLNNSSLPIYNSFRTTYSSFAADPSDVLAFIQLEGVALLRAFTYNDKKYPRNSQFVHSIDDCSAFLDSLIPEGAHENYKLMLTDQGPAKYSGTIISKKESLLIEMIKGNLNPLVHGARNPDIIAQFGFHGNQRYGQMRFLKSSDNEKTMVWNVLKYLRIDDRVTPKNIPKMRFLQGYFEFDISKKDKIHFMDFIDNAAYRVL